MAKKKNSNRSRRVANANTKRSLHRTVTQPSPMYLSPISQDDRYYNPTKIMGLPEPITITSKPARIYAPSTNRNSPQPSSRFSNTPLGQLAFVSPKRVLTCIRRAVRKQIMHATGAAGGKVKKPKYNRESQIKC